MLELLWNPSFSDLLEREVVEPTWCRTNLETGDLPFQFKTSLSQVDRGASVIRVVKAWRRRMTRTPWICLRKTQIQQNMNDWFMFLSVPIVVVPWHYDESCWSCFSNRVGALHRQLHGHRVAGVTKQAQERADHRNGSWLLLHLRHLWGEGERRSGLKQERKKTIQASFSILRHQENEIQSQEVPVWDVGSFNSIMNKISDWIVETTPKLSWLHVLTSEKAMRARAVKDRLTLMASVNILVLSM